MRADRINYLFWVVLAACASLLGIRAPFSSLPIAGGLPLLVVVLAPALLFFFFDRLSSLRFNFYCGAVYLAASLFIFSAMYSPTPMAGIDNAAKILVGVLLISYINNSNNSVHAFMKSWGVASSLLISVYTLNSYFVLDSSYLVNGFLVREKAGKNQLAFYLASFLTVFWVYRLYYAEAGHKLFWGVIFMVHAFAVVYVMSRSAWVSLSVLAFMTIFFRVIFQRKLKELLMLGSFIALTLPLLGSLDFSADLERRLISLVQLEDEVGQSSIQSRKNMVSYSVNEFYANPFWGLGIGAFEDKYNKASHNTYMQYLSEMGLIGFGCIFLIHLVPLIYFLFRVLEKRRSFFLAAGVLSLLVYGLAINIQNSPMWFLAISLFFRFDSERQNDEKPFDPCLGNS